MADIDVGQDWDIINTELTGDYSEVTYSRTIRGFRAQARGESNIRHKRRSSDSNYSTIKSGSQPPYTLLMNSGTVSLGFFAAESGSETLEIVVFF